MSTENLGINGKTVVVAVLVTFVVAGVVGTAIASTLYSTDARQAEGEVQIIVVTPANLDSMQLVAPSGIRSLVMPEGSVGSGSGMTLRSNETVYEFFEENNVTIPTTTREEGYIRITSPEDVPSRDLALQKDDLTQNTSYDRQSAYLACLYENPELGFEVGGTSFPSNVSIPCHAPVLAQFDSVQAGTSKKIGNDAITTPLTLEEGEYKLFGSVGGDCVVLESVSLSATVALRESLGGEPGTCAQSEIGGEGPSGGEELPDFIFLIALALVAGVAAVAYRRS